MMRERLSSSPRAAARQLTLSVDLVLLTTTPGGLGVLLAKSPEPRPRERWTIPWDAPRGEESLSDAAFRVARATLGVAPSALDQVAAFGDNRRHPGDAEVSVAFVGLVPSSDRAMQSTDLAWHSLREVPALTPRHRSIIDAAVIAVRARVDQWPLAFRLLPATFTLSTLQATYELLLGRPLHKASFRRALRAAHLVEATDEWRSEGRGRPAQLFRYAPRKRRESHRGVRFDVLTE
jgi:8-oxo-dGTP diphosphatase